MTITVRRYRLLTDFQKILTFLENNYTFNDMNSYLLKPLFEYAHTHPWFNYKSSHRFGLWTDNNEVIGIVCYELQPGKAFLAVSDAYNELLPEMLQYAENELYKRNEQNQKEICVWITDQEDIKKDLLQTNNYDLSHTEPITIFDYKNTFPERKLPRGYSVISLEDENDLTKIHECIWKGFNHGPKPDDDIEGRLLMQSGPNFRKDLTTVIKAPNGEYACYAGMWLDTKNSYAYLEPLATVPEHRRKGLGTIALTEAMKKTMKFGARYCFGGVPEFYTAIGFKTVCSRELWKKIL